MSKILWTFTKIYVIAILWEKQSLSFHSVWSSFNRALKIRYISLKHFSCLRSFFRCPRTCKPVKSGRFRACIYMCVCVGGGVKKAVRTQEREKLNVEEGQKRFSAPHVLRAHPQLQCKIHSTHHVNKPMWFRPLQTPLGFFRVYIISAFYGFLVFLNEDWFWIWFVLVFCCLKSIPIGTI